MNAGFLVAYHIGRHRAPAGDELLSPAFQPQKLLAGLARGTETRVRQHLAVQETDGGGVALHIGQNAHLHGMPVARDARLTAARDRIIAGLSEIPHSALNGDSISRLPGNVNFCFEGIEGESLLLLLDDKGIQASSGSACTSGSLDPSHVLLAIGRVHDVAHGSLRLSLGEDITDEEVEYIIKSVREVVEHLRSFSPVWRDLCAGKSEFILP